MVPEIDPAESRRRFSSGSMNDLARRGLQDRLPRFSAQSRVEFAWLAPVEDTTPPRSSLRKFCRKPRKGGQFVSKLLCPVKQIRGQNHRQWRPML
jgi:hypothetical protein